MIQFQRPRSAAGEEEQTNFNYSSFGQGQPQGQTQPQPEPQDTINQEQPFRPDDFESMRQYEAEQKDLGTRIVGGDRTYAATANDVVTGTRFDQEAFDRDFGAWQQSQLPRRMLEGGIAAFGNNAEAVRQQHEREDRARQDEMRRHYTHSLYGTPERGAQVNIYGASPYSYANQQIAKQENFNPRIQYGSYAAWGATPNTDPSGRGLSDAQVKAVQKMRSK